MCRVSAAQLVRCANSRRRCRRGTRIAPPEGVDGAAVPSTKLAKLKLKVDHNLERGLVHFVEKSLRFARSEVRSRIVFRNATRVGIGARILGRSPRLNNAGGTLIIGDEVVFDAPITPIYFDLKPNALLRIGDSSYINDGVWFGCTERITIGERALIGPGARFFDSPYHGLYQRRVPPASRPITIEDDVWIASDAIILPGVTIGHGAIVGAHAVVVTDVAAFTVVAGNPARVVRALDPKRFDEAG